MPFPAVSPIWGLLPLFPKFLSLFTTVVCFSVANGGMRIPQNTNGYRAKWFVQRRHLTKLWNVMERLYLVSTIELYPRYQLSVKITMQKLYGPHDRQHYYN